MKIFISWSGETSQKIAGLIKEFIPKVIQSAKPYYTPDDIDKGMKWETEIYHQLEKCEIGLICLTKDNTNKPWILFEAGALSNRLDKAKVCPILFGIKKADIAGPLTTFQMTDFTKEDFFKLIQSINNSLDEPIAENNIKEVFDAFFTKLEDNIKKVLQEENQTDNISKNNSRTERDILEEILLLVRRQERRINSLEEDKRVHNITSSSITDYLSNDFKKGDIVYNEKDGGVGKIVNVHSDLIMVEFQKEEDIPTRKLLPRKLLKKL